MAAGQGRSNRETLFGMTKIPGDSQIRAKLDPIEPSQFQPMFDDVLDELQRSDGIQAFRRLDNHVLIALDGTQYHGSYQVSCPQCSTRQHGNGKTGYHHDMLVATLVAPILPGPESNAVVNVYWKKGPRCSVLESKSNASKASLM